jgi:hypothetical protein
MDIDTTVKFYLWTWRALDGGRAIVRSAVS